MYYTKLTVPKVGARKAGTYMQMSIRFELKPKQRPKQAEEITLALHTIPCYQKAPSLSYKIGDCSLEKDGILRIPDSMDTETVNRLLTHLQEKGFTEEMEETEEKLIIFMPKDSFTDTALENLKKLVLVAPKTTHSRLANKHRKHQAFRTGTDRRKTWCLFGVLIGKKRGYEPIR